MISLSLNSPKQIIAAYIKQIIKQYLFSISYSVMFTIRIFKNNYRRWEFCHNLSKFWVQTLFNRNFHFLWVALKICHTLKVLSSNLVEVIFFSIKISITMVIFEFQCKIWVKRSYLHTLWALNAFQGLCGVFLLRS